MGTAGAGHKTSLGSIILLHKAPVAVVGRHAERLLAC